MSSAPQSPSGGLPGPDETVVFRPRLVRVAGLAVGTLILLAMLIAAVIVPATFGLADRVGFIALGVGTFWFCWREAQVRVVAGPETVQVRNLISKQELEWAEIVAVSFPEGDAWAHLDLADGDTLPVMAFQRADGARGIADARQMARLVAARGEATEAGA